MPAGTAAAGAAEDLAAGQAGLTAGGPPARTPAGPGGPGRREAADARTTDSKTRVLRELNRMASSPPPGRARRRLVTAGSRW
jgi:hypothetical protein